MGAPTRSPENVIQPDGRFTPDSLVHPFRSRSGWSALGVRHSGEPEDEQ
jgi:hypothetical protein